MENILDQISFAASQEAEANIAREDRVSNIEWSPRAKALVYASLALFISLIRFLCELQNFHHARQVGLRIKSTLVVTLYEKSLKRRDLSGAVPATSSDRSETANLPESATEAAAHAERDDEDRAALPIDGAAISHAAEDERAAASQAADKRERSKTYQSGHKSDGARADVGKLVNLMASDINQLLRMGCDLHQLYGAPVEVVIA